MLDRSELLTERRLPESMNLDSMSAADIVALMNAQDEIAVRAVAAVRDDVVRAIELVVSALSRGGGDDGSDGSGGGAVGGAVGGGGRLIYVGAGTSGRLGVLDAAECPPTFRSDPAMIQGIIAGGDAAMFRAQEGAEDSADAGAAAIDQRSVAANDVVVGIAAGGTTPFVHGALRRAAERGARTVFLTCVAPIASSEFGEPKVDVVIRPLVGPEVLTGSTRLKAGTATKLVLNQITTAAMVRLGKCYENLMVDLRATNTKLWDRGARIIRTLTGLDREESLSLLRRADGHVKLAIVMHRRNVNLEAAREILARSNGRLREALGPNDGTADERR